jgi:HK97 family phage prohead protease
MSFDGYGAVFGNVDSYGDVIKTGAFSRYLADVKSGRTAWPMMLSQHGAAGLTAEDMTPIGVWTDLAEDGHGLRVKGQLADTPRGREVYELLRMQPRPALDGMSIGYIAKQWSPRTKPEEPKRTLTDIELVEISVVSRPANLLARVEGVKSIEAIASLRDAEKFMRERFGCSKSEAVAFVSRINGLLRSDSAAADDGPGDPAVDELSALIKRNIGALR